ncbi:hypothetical protein LIER_42373 [Lithospermum erythrorhizon]|uniref:Uncharacterized protein n=1 Tax=Lithospermum erythrorhizon TaxID=34254 RepID=A0AAV3RP65_LITER
MDADHINANDNLSKPSLKPSSRQMATPVENPKKVTSVSTETMKADTSNEAQKDASNVQEKDAEATLETQKTKEKSSISHCYFRKRSKE